LHKAYAIETNNCDTCSIACGCLFVSIGLHNANIVWSINVTAKTTTLPSINGTNQAPKAGYKYVGYNCTVKNIDATDSRGISYMFWILRDTEGSVYTPLWFGGDVQRLTLMDGVSRSQPGDVVKGNVIFEVPKNATLKSLTYDDSHSKIVVTL